MVTGGGGMKGVDKKLSASSLRGGGNVLVHRL